MALHSRQRDLWHCVLAGLLAARGHHADAADVNHDGTSEAVCDAIEAAAAEVMDECSWGCWHLAEAALNCYAEIAGRFEHLPDSVLAAEAAGRVGTAAGRWCSYLLDERRADAAEPVHRDIR